MPDFDNPHFQQGVDLGISLGRSEAQAEAQAAFNADEIELYLDHYRPKTMEDWDDWEKEHPMEEMKNRWIKH